MSEPCPRCGAEKTCRSYYHPRPEDWFRWCDTHNECVRVAEPVIASYVGGFVIRTDIVDRQGDMVTAKALEEARASWEKLKGTTVLLQFALGRPVGVVESVELRKEGLYVLAKIIKPLAQQLDGWTVRPSLRVTQLHREGNVQVIDKMELLGLSLVPKEDAA